MAKTELGDKEKNLELAQAWEASDKKDAHVKELGAAIDSLKVRIQGREEQLTASRTHIGEKEAALEAAKTDC